VTGSLGEPGGLAGRGFGAGMRAAGPQRFRMGRAPVRGRLLGRQLSVERRFDRGHRLFNRNDRTYPYSFYGCTWPYDQNACYYPYYPSSYHSSYPIPGRGLSSAALRLPSTQIGPTSAIGTADRFKDAAGDRKGTSRA
jgi:hypothetical protein